MGKRRETVWEKIWKWLFSLRLVKYDTPPRAKLLVVFICWLAIYLIGLSVPSAPWRNLLVNSSFNAAVKPPPAPTRRTTTLPTNPAAPAIPVPDIDKQTSDMVLALLRTDVTTLDADQERRYRALAKSMSQTLLEASKSEEQTKEAIVLKGWQLVFAYIPLLCLIFLSFSPTNIALLCVTGAMIGANVHRKLFSSPQDCCKKSPASEDPPATDGPSVASKKSEKPEASESHRVEGPLIDDGLAAMHGLCVYLAIYAGLLVIQGNIAFDVEAPDLYLRLSAFATLVSILAGANPQFFLIVRSLFKPFQTEWTEKDRKKP